MPNHYDEEPTTGETPETAMPAEKEVVAKAGDYNVAGILEASGRLKGIASDGRFQVIIETPTSGGTDYKISFYTQGMDADDYNSVANDPNLTVPGDPKYKDYFEKIFGNNSIARKFIRDIKQGKHMWIEMQGEVVNETEDQKPDVEQEAAPPEEADEMEDGSELL